MNCPYCNNPVKFNSDALTITDAFACTNDFCFSKSLVIEVKQD